MSDWTAVRYADPPGGVLFPLHGFRSTIVKFTGPDSYDGASRVAWPANLPMRNVLGVTPIRWVAGAAGRRVVHYRDNGLGTLLPENSLFDVLETLDAGGILVLATGDLQALQFFAIVYYTTDADPDDIGGFTPGTD